MRLEWRAAMQDPATRRRALRARRAWTLLGLLGAFAGVLALARNPPSCGALLRVLPLPSLARVPPSTATHATSTGFETGECVILRYTEYCQIVVLPKQCSMGRYGDTTTVTIQTRPGGV